MVITTRRNISTKFIHAHPFCVYAYLSIYTNEPLKQKEIQPPYNVVWKKDSHMVKIHLNMFSFFAYAKYLQHNRMSTEHSQNS